MITQKRIYELARTYSPTSLLDLANKYMAVDQLGWEEAGKTSLATFASAILGFENDVVTLLGQLGFNANNQVRCGYEVVDTGETEITFLSAFDDLVTADIIILADVRRISDGAVIDYIIGAATNEGFTITTYDNDVAVNYVAIPSALPTIEAPVINGVQFTQNQNVTIANTTTVSSLIGTGVGSSNLSSLFFTSGKTVMIKLFGFISAVSANSAAIEINLGGTAIASSNDAMPINLTSMLFSLSFALTCQTTGETGTVIGQGATTIQAGTGLTPPLQSALAMLTAATIDTTVAQDIGVTLQWSDASASNSITVTNCIIEILN